jgi:uncharacterized protein involved in outer membrane biogenesis
MRTFVGARTIMNDAPRRFRWLKILLFLLVFLVLAGAVALWAGLGYVKREIVAALGPGAEVREISLGYQGGIRVELSGLRLPAEANWHARTLFEAERLAIVLSFSDLLHFRLLAKEIRIDGAFLSLRRSAQGKLEFLPGFMAAAPGNPGMARRVHALLAHLPSGVRLGGGQPLRSPGVAGAVATSADFLVERIVLANGVVEFHDASVGATLRAENVRAELANLHFPALAERVSVQIDGRIAGANQKESGDFHIEGWTEAAGQELDLRATLTGANLADFKAYFLDAAEIAPERGRLDLSLASQVRQGVLDAPVRLALSGLAFAQEGNFLGIPAQFLPRLTQEQEGAIQLDFSLEGDLQDPGFSLNRQFASRARAACVRVFGERVKRLIQEEIDAALQPPPA